MRNILMITAGVAAAAVAAMAYNSFQSTFTVAKNRVADPHKLPKGKQHEAVSEKSHALIDLALQSEYEDVWIKSVDGLSLHGRYYAGTPGEPLEILVHGYRSNPVRDFCGVLKMAADLGHHILLIDQRAHGQSEGKCLTFGVMERQDCKCWVDYAVNRFGADIRMILVGISMGASTVMMASSLGLPQNVVGIIADSGYTSPKDIIRKVLKDRHYNVILIYPLVYLAARLYAHVDLNAASPIESMKTCKIPVLFIHGEEDRFVPCQMSRDNYDACVSEKTLFTVKNAGHGLGYLVDQETYETTVRAFLAETVK